MMSTFHQLKDGWTMITKGAVDVMIRVTSIQKHGKAEPITDEDRKLVEQWNRHYSENGLRVLAVAYRKFDGSRQLTLEDENDLTFFGLIAMMDPPREESMEAVKACKSAGIRPIMLPANHKVTAAAIAKRIGILENESEACEGAVIDNMSDEELEKFVEGISVYAKEYLRNTRSDRKSMAEQRKCGCHHRRRRQRRSGFKTGGHRRSHGYYRKPGIERRSFHGSDRR